MKVNNVFKKIGIVCGLLILLFSPIKVLATGYGEGNYNEGDYPSSGLTPAPTTVTSQNNNSPPTASFNTSPPGCNKSVTSNVPDLFEIRANKNSMLLYFSPPNGEYSSFYIAFSRDSKNWEYGAEYNQGYYPGVLHFTVNLLSPNTTYYVKIRPGNGCATGNWSNIMKATTTSGDKTKIYYKNSKFTNVISNIKSTISKVIPNTKTNKTETATIKPTIVPKTETKPTVIEQKQEVLKKNEKQTTRKKFCIWKWCF